MEFLADPFAQFDAWFAEAMHSEINDPNAMSLATVDATGAPSMRIVLMKGVDHTGFRFYTNSDSRKGQELVQNNHAAICFHWKSLQRQIRATGIVTTLPAAEADNYFAQRYRISQIGAWASQQSQPLADMATLQQRVQDVTDKYDGQAIPRPPYWNGYLLAPQLIEFWAERPHRLHERITYQRVGDSWAQERLYP